MRKIVLSVLSLFFISTAFAQADTVQAPYKKFPSFPPAKLLLPDSATYFTKADLDKKKPVMLMLFNPGCSHCQHETEELTKKMDDFKNIQIIMATSMPFDSMMSFRKTYELDKYPNIVVGQDIHYFLISFYMIHNLPFLAFYNKKKELISVFEGGLPMDRVLEEFKK